MLKIARLLLLAPLVVLAAAGPGAGAAADPVLTGTVGDPVTKNAFKIILRDAAGNRVTHVDPGTYTVVVHDYATMHNFDLTGPGVSQATDIDGTGTTTWTVTFRNGTYTYVCDAHPVTMRGSFTSGVPPAPSVTRLTGRVGPGRKISLRRGTVRVRSLAAGRYKITVRDVTRADNFHLSGPGVNKKTSIRGRKKVTWAVTLRKGTYRYRSDAHKRLGGKFVVFQKPTP